MVFIAECQRGYIDELSFKWPKFSKFECNRWPDDKTKFAALNALQSVVALVSYCGIKIYDSWFFLVTPYVVDFCCSNYICPLDGVELIPGCGTIIESHDNAFTVLTSANLIRCPTSKEFGENALAKNITVNLRNQKVLSYCQIIITYVLCLF